MFVLVRSPEDYIAYGGITILASSASNFFNLLHSRKYISWRPVGGYRFRPHLKAVAVFFAMACASTVYTHLDTVMLRFLTDDTTVGYYHAAVRIKSILVSIVTSLGAVLLPRASYYVERGELAEFRRITHKALNFVFVAALPMMIYFIIFARDGIFLLSGSSYAGAICPMQWIMPTLLFIGLSNVLGIQILVPLGREKTVLWSIVSGAVVDVVLNCILIPVWGASGAAAATSVAELVVLAVQFTALGQQAREAFAQVSYWKLLLALLGGIVTTAWVPLLNLDTSFASFYTLLISAVLFFGVYAGMLLLLKEKLVKELFGQVLGKIISK
jgi:O-antigen/teichoic acid export membrane protein